MTLTLALAVLACARADLEAGVREQPPGSNNGPEIRAYLAGVGVPPPAAWCAAAATAWLRRGAQSLGLAAPVPGSAGALALAGQFERNGLWVPAKLAPQAAAPGWLVFWRRPPGAWQGHVGVLEEVCADGAKFCSIEGNSGPQSDRVARMERRFDDPHLLGLGRLS